MAFSINDKSGNDLFVITDDNTVMSVGNNLSIRNDNLLMLFHTDKLTIVGLRDTIDSTTTLTFKVKLHIEKYFKSFNKTKRKQNH